MNKNTNAKPSRPKRSLKDYYARLSPGYILLFLLIPIGFLFLVFFNFRVIDRVTTENIEYKAASTLLKYSVELDDFLSPGIRILESISYNIEDMFRTDASAEEIEQYLIRETGKLEASSDIDSTGIYGFIKGEYLDGSQWVPDAGYVPTERPWYIEAMQKDGELTYVEPYVDEMTGDTIMTICRLLSDKKSVVAIDIKINQIQEITETLISKDDDPSAVIVLDDGGGVVSHSDPGEIGKNYLEEKNSSYSVIAEKLLREGETEFTVDMGVTRDRVNAMDLGGGWYMLSVTSERKMFAKVFTAFANSVIVGLLGTLLILFTIVLITRKRMEAEDYNLNLKSVSTIYLCLYRINLIDDTFDEINCFSETIPTIVGSRRTGARNIMRSAVILRSDELTRDDILQFTDLSTLDERLKNTNTITCEFTNPDKEWYRARFIAAERGNDGQLKTVLFMVEVIDEEKKARDRLLYLSETDRMTGINNRGSGEHKVRKQLIEGDCGMFLLLDVDKFKSINDTFGHNIGDKVLISIAECMKHTFRTNDTIMRLGGDEFAAFAPMVTNRDAGEVIIGRFLARIEHIRIEEMGDTPIEVSIGVAFYHENDRFSFDELYRRADKCTYESKKQQGCSATFY